VVWRNAAGPDAGGARTGFRSDGSGADWLYTYLRSFYRDDQRPTGWNNTLFANVGMPHVLWELAGSTGAQHESHKLELAFPGQLSPAEYDKQIADLVGFLVWAGSRLRVSASRSAMVFWPFWLFSSVCLCAEEEYWKDVKKN
jgi:ubiquinol-cytochrome c reductase cytochrome c1 subunit